MTPEAFTKHIRHALEHAANPARALPMRAYMKDQFDFFGVPAPARKAITKAAWTELPKRPEADWLLELMQRAWAQPEREFQYMALETLIRQQRQLRSTDLEPLTRVVLERVWWDTIDGFAGHVVGHLVSQNPALVRAMDENSGSQNVWRKRIAILHQLRLKHVTDTIRLERHALENASQTSFWVRKALGWALREYAGSDPAWVLDFFERFEGRFSGLTVREALRKLA